VEVSSVELQLKEAEQRLERVRALYEQYFQGIERTVPHVAKKDLDRRIHVLRKTKMNNTALRFRFQTFQQRYTTLRTYWARVLRQIEEGTRKRDIRRAKRRQSTGGLPAAPVQEGALEQMSAANQRSADDSTTFTVESTVNTLPSKSTKSDAQTSALPAAAELQRLHRDYVKARAAIGKPPVRYEALVSKIEKMAPKLRKKYGTNMSFRVTVREGRVGLKPIKSE